MSSDPSCSSPRSAQFEQVRRRGCPGPSSVRPHPGSPNARPGRLQDGPSPGLPSGAQTFETELTETPRQLRSPSPSPNPFHVIAQAESPPKPRPFPGFWASPCHAAAKRKGTPKWVDSSNL
eukprot:CAMPEP_0179025176 /NCGR_PEP_ID=MMETSP0796-20121207/7843_1 /TAXON_ID=73915 /ORGANISM="Pyrodinium bahamense, Strain pbaha01" /LENGTH=120 /DNA_ID=CAMNT_0020721175 /DNA_START=246 /DNA_END=608 /DNA_ORIENTATION=-